MLTALLFPEDTWLYFFEVQKRKGQGATPNELYRIHVEERMYAQ